jgi:hypothetical protein
MEATVVVRQDVVATLAAKSRKQGHGNQERMSLPLILGQDVGLRRILVEMPPDGFRSLSWDN